jgi:hypothetical protein
LKLRKGNNKELEMFRKLAGLTAVAGLFFAGTAYSATGDMVGSAHDLQAEIASLDDVCSVCHLPHANTVANANGGMLWNHTLSTAGPYTAYQSDLTTGGQPGPVSQLCLSCHDGTVAVDSYFGGSALIDSFTNGGPQFGTTLADDHPIGMTYDAARPEMADLADPVDWNTTVASSGVLQDMVFGASDLVECASCHDVHNTQSSGGAIGEGLLRVDNTNSALCTTCHLK